MERLPDPSSGALQIPVERGRPRGQAFPMTGLEAPMHGPCRD